MALPIWGLFMQKVLNDKSIGIANGETFVAPAGWDMDLSCAGGGQDLSYEESGYSNSEEDQYFD